MEGETRPRATAFVRSVVLTKFACKGMASDIYSKNSTATMAHLPMYALLLCVCAVEAILCLVLAPLFGQPSSLHGGCERGGYVTVKYIHSPISLLLPACLWVPLWHSKFVDLPVHVLGSCMLSCLTIQTLLKLHT